MKTAFDNLVELINIKIDKLIQIKIEKNPEDYNPKYESYGYYNNGVGMASYGGEWVYDEEKAKEDAIDSILEDEDIQEAILNWIKESF